MYSNIPIEVLTGELENYYRMLIEILIERFSATNRFESLEQLFYSISKTYVHVADDTIDDDVFKDPKEIRKRILKPTFLF